MPGFQMSSAALRFFGDDLIPEEVGDRLGAPCTRCKRKGEVCIGKVTGKSRTATTGSWILSAGEQEPEDLDHQIADILARLTDDLQVWRDLTKRFQADMFCGLFMASGNDGFSLGATTLQALSDRGLEIHFDVYDNSDA